MRAILSILLYLGLFATCQAQQNTTKGYFERGDRAIYFFDFGPAIRTNKMTSLSKQLKGYDLPKITNSSDGIHFSINYQSGKRLVLNTSFSHYDAEDSMDHTNLQQRNSELNLSVGYNIFRARIVERFGIVPQVGIYTQRSTLLYERIATEVLRTKIDELDFTIKEGKNKIIRNNSGVFSSLRINYSTRTNSMLDLFVYGIEPGIKYSLSPTNESRIKKNNKLLYRAPEQRLSPFVNIHFKIPFIVWSNLRTKRKEPSAEIFVKN